MIDRRQHPGQHVDDVSRAQANLGVLGAKCRCRSTRIGRLVGLASGVQSNRDGPRSTTQRTEHRHERTRVDASGQKHADRNVADQVGFDGFVQQLADLANALLDPRLRAA
jgi:hypothetical protein